MKDPGFLRHVAKGTGDPQSLLKVPVRGREIPEDSEKARPKPRRVFACSRNESIS